MNYKICVTVAFIAAGLSLMAAEQSLQECEMQDFGGYVRKPKSGKGAVVLLNAQKKVKVSDLKAAFDEIERNVTVDFKVIDVSGVALPNPGEDIRRYDTKVGVVMIDDQNYPTLLCAPEEGWTILNVANLSSGESSPDKLIARTRRELLRAFGLASGCAFMGRGTIVMRNDVTTPERLDTIKEEAYGVDALSAMNRTLPRFGIVPWTIDTYENACQEGWAPAPTNEYQRAIWEKVHTPPTKPIKISYDPAAQKPVVK